ncbi:hypothetical protein BEL04_02050 [Mucilaginibacter sp. PPCGB 2223]|uniref:TolB family protein n=1 Tax=Mucilaginibacter sp. PPCGB 2223 TaxID=1886027 RepID=UPI000825F461|nr:hypothetical protein [Mucilaginibacter sp. PPCGB 2223]OCX53120.1 hypothetical protein BEL04_02050 [Mucilaginibacter sp. PPCGB 2223]
MRTNLKPFILLAFVLTATLTKAQQFGGNPPSIKWNQVNTDAAKVIFPQGMDSAAVRVSNIVSQINQPVKKTLGDKQLQISIVLQNQTTISNAYVGLAPFRSEFFLTPEQNSFELGSLRWTDQLAVHEFRHVQQFNNFNVGVSKALHVLFGEGGQAVGNELTVPNWFFEGDAVYNETYVTKQGRGRLPFYFDGYRALWAAGKNYSWMKLRSGSYRDYTPDWYPTGYMLIAYGREKYGDDFWKKVTHDAAAFDGLFYPLQKAVKNYSGIDFRRFRTDAFNHFKQQFDLTNPQGVSANRSANPDQHFIADEEYPAYINDNTLVYVKTTYDHVPSFVIRTGNQEKVIRVHDYALDNYFNYHDGKIIYASYRPDTRWGYRDYSELNILDVNTGDQTRVTTGSKYFAPAFSADGKSIVAVKISPDGKSELNILNVDGTVKQVIPNKGNFFYTYPKFYEGKILSAIRIPGGSMTLALIDITTGNADYLLTPTMQPIVFPVIKDNKVYFSATSGKTDGLFVLDLHDKKLFRLQNDSLRASIGNYQPAIAGNKIAWVGLTAYGYHVNQSANSTMQWEPVAGNQVPGGLSNMGISVLDKGEAADLLAKVNDDHPEVTKYNKAFHLINFHTLQPSFNDPNYSFGLVGQNVLNTLQSELLYNYNRNEGYSEFGFGTTYGALFPWLTAGIDYITNRKAYDSNSNPVYFDQLQTYLGFAIPLNLTQGHHTTSLAFGSNLFYSRNYFPAPFDNPTNNRSIWYLDNYVNFASHGRQAKKNIYPHIGENFSIDYKTSISNISANQLLATGSLFLPGIGINHSIVLSGAYQQRDKADAGRFSNDFPFSRGYTSVNLYQVYKLAGNYHFPIVYPDAGVANAIFFQRIRANAFYDYSQATLFHSNGSTFNVNFRSTGAEVFFDTQVWNQLPFTFGIRYSRLLDTDIFGGNGANRIELVLPLSVF